MFGFSIIKIISSISIRSIIIISVSVSVSSNVSSSISICIIHCNLEGSVDKQLPWSMKQHII